MQRAQRIGSFVVACLLAGAGLGVAHAQAPAAPPLGATLETCASSALPAGRIASFVGSMPAIAGADRMQMRFGLQRRRPDEKLWRTVSGVQGFGVWQSSLPGRAGFVFHKRIDGLQVPATYRARVLFRWKHADGTVVRRAARRTPACAQPDLRPDLAPGALRAVLDARPALAVYTLAVRNDGRSHAGSFAVRVAGGVGEVRSLAPGEQVDVTVVAPACALGASIAAVVDADRRVDEADEDNVQRRSCPLPA